MYAKILRFLTLPPSLCIREVDRDGAGARSKSGSNGVWVRSNFGNSWSVEGKFGAPFEREIDNVPENNKFTQKLSTKWPYPTGCPPYLPLFIHTYVLNEWSIPVSYYKVFNQKKLLYQSPLVKTKRQTDRKSKTDRKTPANRHSQTHKPKHTNRQTHTKLYTQPHTHTDTHTHTHRHRHTHTQTHRNTHRQSNLQTHGTPH